MAGIPALPAGVVARRFAMAMVRHSISACAHAGSIACSRKRWVEPAAADLHAAKNCGDRMINGDALSSDPFGESSNTVRAH